MFERVCKVITRVLKIRERLYPPLLSSLSNLKILKALRVDVPLIYTEVLIDTNIPTIDPTAIRKSKIFQPSRM
jgi:hypothetical protein